MSKRSVISMMFFSLSLVVLSSQKAEAFLIPIPIPVTDASTIAQNVLNDFRMVLEAKFTDETKKLAGKMNNVIGNTPFDPKKIFEEGYISQGEDKGDYGQDDEGDDNAI